VCILYCHRIANIYGLKLTYVCTEMTRIDNRKRGITQVEDAAELHNMKRRQVLHVSVFFSIGALSSILVQDSNRQPVQDKPTLSNRPLAYHIQQGWILRDDDR
jgi:hypothetical protein